MFEREKKLLHYSQFFLESRSQITDRDAVRLVGYNLKIKGKLTGYRRLFTIRPLGKRNEATLSRISRRFNF